MPKFQCAQAVRHTLSESMLFCWSSPLNSGINRELVSSVHWVHFFWQREGPVRSFKMFYKPLTVSPHSWTMLHCSLAQAVSGQVFKKYNVHQGKAAHQALYNTTWWYAHTFRLEWSCAKKIQTLGVRKWGKCKVQEIPEIGTCDITSPWAHSKKRERKPPVSGPLDTNSSALNDRGAAMRQFPMFFANEQLADH